MLQAPSPLPPGPVVLSLLTQHHTATGQRGWEKQIIHCQVPWLRPFCFPALMSLLEFANPSAQHRRMQLRAKEEGLALRGQGSIRQVR